MKRTQMRGHAPWKGPQSLFSAFKQALYWYDCALTAWNLNNSLEQAMACFMNAESYFEQIRETDKHIDEQLYVWTYDDLDNYRVELASAIDDLHVRASKNYELVDIEVYRMPEMKSLCILRGMTPLEWNEMSDHLKVQEYRDPEPDIIRDLFLDYIDNGTADLEDVMRIG